MTTADEFNAQHPVGTPVRYWPAERAPAWPLGHGEAVVSVHGRTGGIARTHIETGPMDDDIDPQIVKVLDYLDSRFFVESAAPFTERCTLLEAVQKALTRQAEYSYNLGVQDGRAAAAPGRGPCT